MRFTDAELSIAIACNDGYSDPQELAWQVADYYLADRLEPHELNTATEAEEDIVAAALGVPSGSEQILADFAGDYFSSELGATYRLAVEDARLIVRIEQEPPVDALAIADDQFEIGFEDAPYWDPPAARLQFVRDEDGVVTGFSLSSWTEVGIEFEKQH